MKKFITFSIALAMVTSLCSCGSDKSSSESSSAESTTAAEAVTPEEQFLQDISGTYDELFTVICDPKYDQLWLDKCEAIVGADMAADCAEMLKTACTGTVYGEEAVKKYTDPEEAQFDCYFINGVDQFVFDGNKISGLDEKGEKGFEHEYSYVKDLSLGGMMDGALYETSDENAGEFRYFFMMPDTPATTYHIEFRYGSDEAALAEYAEGSYAYWLAAGIPADYDDKLIDNVIRLFVEENLSDMGEESSAASEGDTIEIGTAEELVSFAKSVTDGSMGGYAGKTVVLTDDIDCTDIEWTPIGTMDLDDMSNHDCMFQGVFDGQGHTISNVTFDSNTPICGAGIIGMNLGEVKNLTAKNINIHCTDTYSMAVGGVVGYNMGEIHDVTLTGENEIAGVNAIGGITGGSTNHVHDCTVDGTTIKVLGDNDFSDGRIIQCDIAECGGLIIGGSFGGTIENCTAQGKIIAEGNEPVGMGGIAGCLEMMDSVTDCTADVEIISAKGGHAIGGLCGYSGTHSVGDIALATEGVETHVYPGIIKNCSVTVKMNVPGATHVGGLIGTGLYYYGEETAFKVVDCSVKGEITGAVTPGAVAGRAENSVIESCTAEVTLDGTELTDQIGKTDRMYESSDQEGAEEAETEEITEAEKKEAA